MRKATKPKARNVDFIVCSDLHLRDTIPVCRTDNFIKAMENKLNWLQNLSEKYNRPYIICAGDIFHHWKTSPWLINFTIDNFPEAMISIPGQHDLPNHSYGEKNRSGYAVLERINKINKYCVFYGLYNYSIFLLPYGVEDETKYKLDKEKTNIALLHKLIWQGSPPFPGAPESGNVKSILKEYSNYDIIIAGDNHKGFLYQEKGRSVIVPGSMMRTTADQADYKPRVYLIYSDGTIKLEYYPIEEGVVTREHLEKEKTKDERMQTFVKRLDDSYEAGLDVEENFERYFRKNNTVKPVRKIINECLED